LKVKTFHDEEAKVTGYRDGEGRLLGVMGAIECVLPNGKDFHIGTGFSDNQRKHPPKVGDVVTFKYQELSNNGHPRFPVFIRVRKDLTWEDVLKNAKDTPPASSTQKVIPELKKEHTLLFSTVPSRDKSGNKIVTDQDALSDEEIEEKKDSNNKSEDGSELVTASLDDEGNVKPICKYGATCYRKNADHLKKFSHGKSTTTTTVTTTSTNTSTTTTAATTDDLLVATSKSDADDTELLEDINPQKDNDNIGDLKDNSKGDISDDVQSDDDEQALITKKEWKQVVNRLAKLEASVYSLQNPSTTTTANKNSNNNSKNTSTTTTTIPPKMKSNTKSKKRPVDDSVSVKPPAKKQKSNN